MRLTDRNPAPAEMKALPAAYTARRLSTASEMEGQ